MPEEPQTITIEVELDPIHQQLAEILEQNGVKLDELALREAQPAVEGALYKALQTKKYDED